MRTSTYRGGGEHAGGERGVVRAWMTPLAWWVVVVPALACGSREPSPPPDEETRELTPADLFPMTVGDRWARESEGEHSLRVVTARAGAAAVFFGTDRTTAERFALDEGRVALVSPDGDLLAPYLDAPIAIGHEWAYTLGDQRCVASYAEAARRFEVAGRALDDCVLVRRRCEGGKAEEGAASADVAVAHEELFCPGVGRVSEELRLVPAPDGIPGRRAWRVTYYRVAGAPALPAPESIACERLLLAPTDVQAACGSAFRPAGSAMVDGACRMRFAAPGGVLEVRARSAHPADDAAMDALALEPGEHARAEGNLRRIVPSASGGTSAEGVADEAREASVGGFAFTEGAIVFAVRVTTDACAPERAQQLEPLLRSLVRP
ncbi:MAG: hypothetical protein KF901_04245 [Myxococcales bacterium]|nr:hypothetical protein [Myxococcales bacterium]